MDTLQGYSRMIEEAIDSLNYNDRDLPSLYDPIIYGLSAGGKRLRPLLLLISAEAAGGNAQDALPQAQGIEMFHNFTLLHDDVMDNSDTRRGRPTVMKKYGTNAAILSGDTMLTLATQLISCGLEENLRPVLDEFNGMAIDVYEGQAMDMDFEHRQDVTLHEYMDMIGLKTGALLGAACAIGALTGGASQQDAFNYYEYGFNLGIAFQVQDDYLDLYGDAATFGKPIGGDILNDKKTFLVLKAKEIAGADRDDLSEALAMAPGQEKIERLRIIYTELDMPGVCAQEIQHFMDKATEALQRLDLPEEARALFDEVTAKVTGRKK